MAELIKNILFGFNIDDDTIKKIFFDEKKIEIRFFLDLFQSQFPIIKEVQGPYSIHLENNEGGNVRIQPRNFSITEVFYENNLIETSIVWNKFNDYVTKVCDKLEVSEISEFAFRQIEIVEVGKETNVLDARLKDFLEKNKIIDSKTELEFKSNSFYYKKGNKKFSFKVEPYLKEKKSLLLDMDISFEQRIPINNIGELIKQEIKYFSNIKINIEKNYVTAIF
ncbi:MAG: hypothetical protein KDC42_10175 [Ignavibacteriae bacterium]|nr:hypothetical protein [Ignavibacteriota bacterium]